MARSESHSDSPSDSGGRVVAIVGATGAVGEVLLRVLEERSFPIRELRPLASERSVGSRVAFAGRDLPVELARPEAFEGADFVFFAATGSLSKDLAPEVASRGGIAIDKSSTWRLHDDVPLVIPEINGEAVEKHRGIIACPNCTTVGFAMATMTCYPTWPPAGRRCCAAATNRSMCGRTKALSD